MVKNGEGAVEIFTRESYTDEWERAQLGRGMDAAAVATRAYEAQIKISKQKHEDLMELCESALIPSEFVEYYANLPH